MPDTLDYEIAGDLRDFAQGHEIIGEPPREPGIILAGSPTEPGSIPSAAMLANGGSIPSPAANPLRRLTGERNPMVAFYFLLAFLVAAGVLIAKVCG